MHRRCHFSSSLGSRLMLAGMMLALLTGLAPAPVAAQAVLVAQPLPDDLRTITVTGTGIATASAETAHIQIAIAAYSDFAMEPVADEVVALEPEPGVEDGTPEAAASPARMEESGWTGYAPLATNLTEADLQPMVDAMVAAGAPAEAITVRTGPGLGGSFGRGSPGYGLIEILAPDPTVEQVNAIVEAAGAAATESLTIEQIGVGYDVADCAPLLDEARQAAFDDARARAEALAGHFGATVEAPVQVTDFGGYLVSPPAGENGGCPPSPLAGFSTSFPFEMVDTPPFDDLAPAEARAEVQLSVTYEFVLAGQ